MFHPKYSSHYRSFVSSKPTLLVCILLIASSFRAFAQDKDYQVVVTASTQPRLATMQRIVIDTTLLQAFRGSSLSELLIQSSPINIKSHGRGGTQSATFRGTAPSHTLVHWNGIRINSPMAGSVDFGQIPLFFIDKLTIESGVSSMTTSSGALGGNVSIESAPTWGKKFGIELFQGIGSFSTSDTYLRIMGGNTSSFQSSTKLFYSRSKNDFPFTNRDIKDPETNTHPVQRNTNGNYRRYGFMQEFFIRPDQTQLITVVVWGMDNNSNIPNLTTYEGSSKNNLTNSHDRSLRASVTHKKYLSGIEITSRITGDLQSMDFFQKNYTIWNTYDTVINSRNLSRSAAAAVDVAITKFRNHTIGVTGVAQIDYARSINILPLDPVLYPDRVAGFEKSRTEFSLMGSLNSQWTSRLASSVAIRGIAVAGQLHATPFAGLEYRISVPIALKARVGYNVHNPTLSDLYYVPGGNPDLRVEKGLTAELGASYSKDNTRVELTLFNSWIDDWILWEQRGKQFFTPMNVKKVLSQGVELSGSNRWCWNNDWALFANISFTMNRTINNGEPSSIYDDSVGKQLTGVPLFSGGVYLNCSWKKTWVSYRLHGESIRYAESSNQVSAIGNLNPYILSEIAAGYSWGFLSLEVRCNNLFDKQLYTVFRRPLPGRNFEAIARFKF